MKNEFKKINISRKYSVSIVVPVFNEEKNIETLINDINNQTLIPNEIIIVDDGSTDKTVELLSKYNNVKVLKNPDKGINSARDFGTRSAKSKIIIQTDGDITLPNDFVDKIINVFKSDNKIIGVSGVVKDRYGRVLETVVSIISNSLFDGIGACTAFKKSCYLRTNGYRDDTYIHGGDIKFWNEFKKLGKCVHNHDIVVLHNSGFISTLFYNGIVSGYSYLLGGN